jgi:lipopolysaccharide transport system permease protein
MPVSLPWFFGEFAPGPGTAMGPRGRSYKSRRGSSLAFSARIAAGRKGICGPNDSPPGAEVLPEIYSDRANCRATGRKMDSRSNELAAAGWCDPLDAPARDETPLLVIEPNRTCIIPDFAGLWQYRELLYFLTWRDVKIRYKQTFLGAAWAVIQPLFTMLVFTLFFGNLAKVPSDGIPYPLFAYAGLLPWTFFANAVTNSGNSLVGGAHLVTKVYFPRVIIPAAAVFAGLVDLAIALVIFAVPMACYRVPLTAGILVLPFLLLLLSTLAVSVGMWMAALNVKYRDIRYALPFVIQLWMFLTPVIYPASIVPRRYQMAYALNPLAGIIEVFRVALLGGVNGTRIEWGALGLSVAVVTLLLLVASHHFRRMEREFADLI